MKSMKATAPDTSAQSRRAIPLWAWPAAVGMSAGLCFLLFYLTGVFTHESTDDAFIAAHVMSVAPRIPGQVVAVHIADNQRVESNQLLVELDPVDYAMTVAQKQAAADAQQANYKTLLAGCQLMLSKVATAQADARKAQSEADAGESTAKRARADFDRVQDLLRQKTVSQQEFDAVQAADSKARADWQSARESAAAAASRVEEARLALAAAGAQAGTVLAQWQESQTNVAAAQITLAHTRLFAPAAGRVVGKAVEPGDCLQAGQQILSIVPEAVWVVANFKESQLKPIRVGQAVSVAIDALGGRRYRGHVDSIQAGSGAAFSLLPPENASGNFVKVVQRVPVKIVFDESLPGDRVIGPGLSVTPSVEVSPFVFPAWAAVLLSILAAGAMLAVFTLTRKPVDS